MSQEEEIIEKILEKLIASPEVITKNDFHKLKNDVYKEFRNSKGINDISLLRKYREMVISGSTNEEIRILKLLRKRAIRSLSGVAVVSILTKPWTCSGTCIYCPNFEDLPKSYIPNEPAVMRAMLNDFDPIKQIHNRLRSLDITGHNIDKCDDRIIGGTWSNYPMEYRENYIKDLYDAHSSYEELRKHIVATDIGHEKFASFEIEKTYEIVKSPSLEEAKKRNESALSRVIGIAIETRPDYIDIEEIKSLRKLGVTRVEIGYQTTIDAINILNKRGHTNKESIEATKLLKDAGLKVVAHIMPNLYGSNPELDLESLRNIFENPSFRPDELKIYPMVVTDNSELTNIWKAGKFKPYSDEELIELMVKMKALIPEYVRLNRMYRDIPATEILAGSHLANLRQIVEEKMKLNGIKAKDISAREIRLKNNIPTNATIDIVEFEASEGKEYYLQFIDPEDRTLFSHLRLRIPSQIFSGKKHFIEELQDSAIIREVHTYGDQLKIGEKADGTGQHLGFGKRLMEKAEEIVRTNYPQITKIAVIAGVGVRKYYEKHGYKLEGEYMVKELKCN
ncbi:MAG: tRNA uridine(34) 5-carboxymethylaminomethyl modification radical SAM/GNAT enzyme Elp3 [Candidatus Gracilibacteria bacterium]|nr:tRNA uridine(34) 5-carboxymethylaminomethyl modification radical SAM/GNAT enzyme Elp3 [Candidatus Gracilibacteria bacterium]MDD2908878.1 tRNA uridine(34) 5-carboxymethylaminomethyl modification radical SAM/GNAT enzyme Elp3 [Candidatus Gracilibacteria bacterium]